ncbi:hypothetical protein BTS2_2615 [Bacillus sp. TS-2]|nr:hypothetical protein BTS2_2615 [Bacillus sp. TS-2]
MDALIFFLLSISLLSLYSTIYMVKQLNRTDEKEVRAKMKNRIYFMMIMTLLSGLVFFYFIIVSFSS